MAVDMFIKIGDIKGESKDKTHKGEVDVLAWSWGMSNSGTTHMGGGGGSGKVSVQDLSFTKYIDASSNALLKACCETPRRASSTTSTASAARGRPTLTTRRSGNQPAPPRWFEKLTSTTCRRTKRASFS